MPAQADLEKEPPEAPPWLDDYDSSPSDSGGPAPTGPLGTYDGGPAEAYDGSRSVPFEPPLQADDLEAARLQRGPTQVSNAASNAVDRSGKTGAVGEWATLIKAADLRGGARQLADHCEVASSTDKRIELILAADKETLNTQQLRTRLQDAIGQHLGMQVTLTVTSGKPPRPTPAEVRMANENARMRRARVSMEQDPNVKAAQDAFGAVLEADTIQPTGDD